MLAKAVDATPGTLVPIAFLALRASHGVTKEALVHVSTGNTISFSGTAWRVSKNQLSFDVVGAGKSSLYVPRVSIACVAIAHNSTRSTKA